MTDPSDAIAAAVVIPVRGALDHLERCLRSVTATPSDLVREIVLVDDGGPENRRLPWLIDHVGDRRVRIIRNLGPRGFSAAANRGVEAARAAGAEVVLLLNSDVILIGAAGPILVSGLLSDPRLAAVGPLSNAAGVQSVPDRSVGPVGVLLLRPPGVAMRPELVAAALSSSRPRVTVVEVPLVHGFALALRVDRFLAVGGFDEAELRSGHGAEADLSIRLREAGSTLAVVPEAFIWHAGSASTGGLRRFVRVAVSRRTLWRRHGRARLAALRAEAVDALEGSVSYREVRARLLRAGAGARPGSTR